MIDDGVYLKNEGSRKKKKRQFEPNVEKTPVPIKKVRVKFKSNTIQILKRESITAQLSPNSSINIEPDKYQYVNPGNNYLFAIYGDIEVNNRDKHIVTWFEKAQIDIENAAIKKWNKKNPTKEKLYPYYPQKELPLLCTLEHNNMVIMFDESPDEINWEDKEELFNRLFTVVKFTENHIVFARHNAASILADKAQTATDLLSAEGQVRRPNANTYRGIKVELNMLGEIIKN
ncbi:MAG: hypothetical protein PF487_06400 [Bacteroidales bacterium]|nr:hypothetical protein [Bacteroidales bacterium]